MTPEQMQEMLVSDLSGDRGREAQSAAVLEVANRMISRAMSDILVCGSGDIGVKRPFEDTIIISDA